jgi:hypothetical protein
MLKRSFGILIFLLVADLSAQEPLTVLFGQNWLNGRGWHLLDSNAKSLYITAFGEGTGIAIINWLTTGKPKPSTDEFQRQESVYTSDAAFSTDDTSQQIDKFYNIAANLDIPVAYAVLFVTAKFRGASAQDLDAYTVRLRKMVSERSGHVPPPLKTR